MLTELFILNLFVARLIAVFRCLSPVVRSLYDLSPKSCHCRMHRLRLSSEGPEVVSQIPDKFFVPYLNRSPRSALYQKQIDGKSPVPLYPIPSLREGSSGFDEDQQDRGFARGSISLFTTLLIIAAFLLGGGVGGGIGGAFISKDRATIAKSVFQVPTSSEITSYLFAL